MAFAKPGAILLVVREITHIILESNWKCTKGLFI